MQIGLNGADFAQDVSLENFEEGRSPFPPRDGRHSAAIMYGNFASNEGDDRSDDLSCLTPIQVHRSSASNQTGAETQFGLPTSAPGFRTGLNAPVRGDASYSARHFKGEGANAPFLQEVGVALRSARAERRTLSSPSLRSGNSPGHSSAGTPVPSMLHGSGGGFLSERASPSAGGIFTQPLALAQSPASRRFESDQRCRQERGVPSDLLHSQLAALERRLMAKLRTSQQECRANCAVQSTLDQRLAIVEGSQEGVQSVINEFRRTLSALSESAKNCGRQIGALDADVRECRNQLKDEMQSSNQELEQRMQKLATSMRTNLASLEDGHVRLQNFLREAEHQIEETKSDFDVLGARIIAQECENSVQNYVDDNIRAAALGRDSVQESCPDTVALQERINDLTGEVHQVTGDTQDMHTRLTAQEERLRHLRTHFDTREDQFRVISEWAQKGEYSAGTIENLRSQLDSEKTLSLEHSERLELLEKRADTWDASQDELRETIVRFGRISRNPEAVCHIMNRATTSNDSNLDKENQEVTEAGLSTSIVKSLNFRLSKCEAHLDVNQLTQGTESVAGIKSQIRSLEERTVACEDKVVKMDAVLEKGLHTMEHDPRLSRISEMLSHVKAIAPKVVDHERFIISIRAKFGDHSVQSSSAGSGPIAAECELSGETSSSPQSRTFADRVAAVSAPST